MSVGVDSSHSSFRYTEGFVDDCPTVLNSNGIDHVVLLIGYTETHWIIKNSWGTYFGDNGFAYVSKTKNCGISNLVNFLAVDGPRFGTDDDVVVDIPEGHNLFQIKMVDTWGDGWESIFAFKQNGVEVANFGSEFNFVGVEP